MDFNEYQKEASRTFSGDGDLIVAALGLCGESGEVADIVKNHIAQGHALNREKVIEELGDILWYIALAASSLDVTLESIAMANNAKLRKRYPDGFSVERSVNRQL